MRGLRGTGAVSASAAAATLLIALSSAHAAPRNTAHLSLFPGRGGAATVWISANNAGQAVGQKLKGSLSDFVFFDGRHAHDLTVDLGHGAFSSIDQLGEAAGTTSQGYPLYYDTASGRKATLTVQGRATGIAVGPLVAVTLPTGAAELWNPLSGATLSLGDSTTTGANAWGTVVGNSNGYLWYSVPDGHGGAMQRTLPTWGNFDHVNELNVATGYRDVRGGIKPVSYDIQSGKLTEYKLPKGYKYGVLTGENDSGTIAYGNAFRTSRDLKSSKSIGVLWRNPGHPMEIPYDTYLHGFAFTGQSAVSAVTDSAIAVGEVTIRQNEVADILRPRIDEKLVGLKRMVVWSWLATTDKTDVYSKLVKIQKLAALQENDAACARIGDLVSDVRREAFLEAFDDGPDSSYFLALYDGFDGGLQELSMELGCPSSLRVTLERLKLPPKPAQSPYAGGSLAWTSSTY